MLKGKCNEYDILEGVAISPINKASTIRTNDTQGGSCTEERALQGIVLRCHGA